MASPIPVSVLHERIAFVERIVVGDDASTCRDVLRQTLARIEHDTPGTIVAVRVNVVRRMSPPEVARLRLDPARGTWMEMGGDVLRVVGTR